MKFTSFLTVLVGCYIPALAFGDGPPFSCPKPMAIPDAWTDLNQNGYNPTYSLGTSRNNLILTKFLWVFVESLGPSSAINVRIVDATIDGPVATIPTTWGRLKSKY
jgi:hypothetical protein